MYCIGIDIGGTKCIVTLASWCDDELWILATREFPTRVVRGPEAILQEIEQAIDELMVLPGSAVDCIGISCGGPLDSINGLILSPPNLPGWDRIEIVTRLREKYGIPTFLENDANAGALAEWKFGAGIGTTDMVFLTFGTGLGAGLILGGKMHRGVHGLAGELGHWQLADEGPVNYGKKGTFQGFCSGNGIAQWYRYITSSADESVTGKTVADLARAGDAVATEVYRQAGVVLGKGLAFLMDLLAPQLVVIGGVFCYAHDLLWPHAEASLKAEVLPALYSGCQIVQARLGRDISSYASCIVAIYGYEQM